MQHGIFIANFDELPMNRVLPVGHERLHQVEAIIELPVIGNDRAHAVWKNALSKLG